MRHCHPGSPSFLSAPHMVYNKVSVLTKPLAFLTCSGIREGVGEVTDPEDSFGVNAWIGGGWARTTVGVWKLPGCPVEEPGA